MPNAKIKRLFVPKKIVIGSVLTGVVTVVVFIFLTANWQKYSPQPHNHDDGQQRFHKYSLSDAERNKSAPGALTPVTLTTGLSDKIIKRRTPYLTEPACHNFSVSVYEDETFELTGLVSYPGSGNTWTRHLIQLATGVYTGSFYFDMELFARGFLGEQEIWHSGRTIVQKFHENYDPRMHINRAIVIIREPFPAILSFANYLEAGHTGNAYLLPYHHKDWPHFLLQSAYKWLSLAKSWIESPATTLVIHYEHLRLQPIENLGKICQFLNHTCPYLLSPCFKEKLEGSFHRGNLYVTARKDGVRTAKYPPEIKSVINSGIDYLDNMLTRQGHEPVPFDLYQYYSSLEP